MPRTYVVTGTDTGVGKSVVSSCLVAALHARGVQVKGLKPFETGCWRDEGGQWVGEDSLLLAQASESSPHDNGLYRFEPAVGPRIAAKQAGVSLDLNRVVNWIRSEAERQEVLLVEGVGGLMVPLTAHETVLDLIQALKPDGVVLVSTNRLGVLSQVLTAHYVLRHAGLPLAGVILTPGPDPEGLAEQTNEAELREMLSPVLVCPRVRMPADTRSRVDMQERALVGRALVEGLGWG